MWDVKGLRFSTFYAPGTMSPADNLAAWPELVGSDPTVQTTGSGPQRVAIYHGPWGSRQLRAELRHDRVDWHVVAAPAFVLSSAATSVTGSYQTVTADFRRLIEDWLSPSQWSDRINRLAFAPSVGRSFDTRRESMAFLNHAQAHTEIRDDLLNFSLTLGELKRTPSTVQELNVLQTWAAQEEQMVEFQVALPDQQPTSSTAPARTLTSYTGLLALDVNTRPSTGEPFSSTRVLELVGELFEVAQGEMPEEASQ